PAGYRQEHGRALDYWLEHPYHDPVVQAQNLLYHRIIVDPETARQELVNIFEQYVSERQLGAMEKLLKAASEACGYLTKLGGPTRGLPELILYMRARQAQLQGNWQDSEEMLDGIDIQAEPGLQPFVTRALGFARSGQRDFAGAIEQFQLAADQFAQRVDILGEEWSLAERADTLIALGDAYLDLAEASISLAERRKRHQSSRRFLQGVYYLLLSLPLAFYMTRAIGFRAWLPYLWAMWRDVDWIKADLYSQATRHYREAGRLLEQVDRPDRNLVADEKLADLYLSVGDAVEARTLYERLLASKELSDYRRSRIEVSLGQTQWLLGDEENAEQVLAGAISALRYYADETLEAKAESVLGSIAADSDDPAAALSHFSRALDIYLVEGNADLVSATDVAEQLDLVAENPSLTPEARAASKEQAARVVERRYPVQQRFALTRFFQQLFLFSVVVLGGIGLLNMITIDRTTVVPDIVFHATPLLDAARGEPALMVGTTTYAISDTSEIILGQDVPAELQVAQGIRSLVVANPELRFALAGIFIAFAGYLTAVTLIGILLLWRIEPREVQDRSQSSTVIFSDEAIAVGEEGARKSVSLGDVSHYITSNTRLFRHPTSDSYLLLEIPSGEQVIVSGATAHYENLQKHIEERLSATAERTDLSHSLLISLAGVLLLLTVVLYLLIVIFSRAGEDAVNSPIAGSPYTGVTLLPYLLLGFLLPVLWWFVWKPLQRRHRLDKFDWSPFLLILIGLLIVLTIIIVTGLGYHVRLSTPDLYPALAAIGLMLAGTTALTVTALRKRHRGADEFFTTPSEEMSQEIGEQDERDGRSGESLVKRAETRAQTISDRWRILLFVLLYILLLLVSALAILYISTEVRAYHYWVQGEETLKEADRLKNEQTPGWQETIEKARQNYSEAIRIAEGARWKFFPDDILADIYTNRAHASLILGIEELAQASGLADTETADLTYYESALADYEKAIELDPNSAQGYLWLGFAHHTAGDTDAARENYSRAIDFGGLTLEELQTWNSGASCPRDDEESIYLPPEQLAKAFTGLGWIYFSEEDYRNAQADFLFASAYADCLEQDIVQERSEAALGLGYTYYKDRRFDEAENVWLQAEERDPQNAALLISLGTIYWRLGTLGEDYSEKGKDRCLQDSLSEEEKRDAADLLEKSIDYLRRSAEIDGQLAADVAYTYRTIGQVQYLLRDCPGYDKYLVFKDAVESYSKAIELNSEEYMYPFMRARLRYAQWNASPISGPDGREPVVKALVDITETLRMLGESCPESDYDFSHPCWWFPVIRKQAVNGVIDRGDERFAKGEYGTAIGYYMLLIDNVPEIKEITSVQLRLSVAELARGNPA
ncbi:MAG: tetratricopeptide repeat protein, partial [Candidatus Promineifilaceae bacterium]